MAVALLVTLVPPLLFAASWQEWIYKGLTLLLIGCPCALVISTPAAITSGLAAAARRGALIKAERRWNSWVVLLRWRLIKPALTVGKRALPRFIRQRVLVNLNC